MDWGGSKGLQGGVRVADTLQSSPQGSIPKCGMARGVRVCKFHGRQMPTSVGACPTCVSPKAGVLPAIFAGLALLAVLALPLVAYQGMVTWADRTSGPLEYRDEVLQPSQVAYQAIRTDKSELGTAVKAGNYTAAYALLDRMDTNLVEARDAAATARPIGSLKSVHKDLLALHDTLHEALEEARSCVHGLQNQEDFRIFGPCQLSQQYWELAKTQSVDLRAKLEALETDLLRRAAVR